MVHGTIVLFNSRSRLVEQHILPASVETGKISLRMQLPNMESFCAETFRKFISLVVWVVECWRYTAKYLTASSFLRAFKIFNRTHKIHLVLVLIGLLMQWWQSRTHYNFFDVHCSAYSNSQKLYCCLAHCK